MNDNNNSIQSLQEEIAALQQLNRDLEDIFAYLGHDLQNQVSCLSVESAKLGMLMKHASAEQHEALERVQSELSALMMLVRNYLTSSRIDDLVFAPSYAFVDPHREIISPMLEDLVDLFSRKQVTCQVQVSNPQTLLWGDAAFLKSACENIVANAVRYAEDDSLIAISLSPRGAEDEFSIRYSGRDVSEGHIDTMVERFTTGQSGKGRDSGDSIGLYLARKIIEAHDGRCWVEAEPGVWVNLVFTLPRRNAVRAHRKLANSPLKL
jgi:two-component system phosphate regulon sensor histidine kinase PhoR